jgi:hypothetical protein
MTENPYQSPAAVPQSNPVAPSTSLLFTAALCGSFVVGTVLLLATGSIGSFFWLAYETVPLPILIAWPVSVPASIWLGIAAFQYLKNPKQWDRLNRQPLWIVPLIVIPFAMLVWGAVFEYPRGQMIQRWHLAILYGALGLQVCLATIAIAANSGMRSLVGAAVVLLLLLALACALMASFATRPYPW